MEERQTKPCLVIIHPIIIPPPCFCFIPQDSNFLQLVRLNWYKNPLTALNLKDNSAICCWVAGSADYEAFLRCLFPYKHTAISTVTIMSYNIGYRKLFERCFTFLIWRYWYSDSKLWSEKQKETWLLRANVCDSLWVILTLLLEKHTTVRRLHCIHQRIHT